MIYAYLRVSTDKQENDNQRFQIKNFAQRNNIKINKWVEDIMSGTKDPSKRKLGDLLNKVHEGDLIISAELSRIGRNLYMITDVLKELLEAKVQLWTIKDNFRLDDSIQSKVLAFAFGLSAEIERTLLSQRVKESLARRKSEGKVLGRPLGSVVGSYKLLSKKSEVKAMLKDGMSKSSIAKKLHVHRDTLAAFINRGYK